MTFGFFSTTLEKKLGQINGYAEVKSKASWSGGKIMATVFWDADFFLERKQTVTSVYYESALRKLAKNLVKIHTMESLIRKVFSTMIISLSISFIKQREYCENFDGNSLAVHFTVLIYHFLTFSYFLTIKTIQ